MSEQQLFQLVSDAPFLLFSLTLWWYERQERIRAQRELIDILKERESPKAE